MRAHFVWLILLPIAIHWPALSGWLSADPLYLESGLTSNWLPNGVLPGLPGWIDGNAGITLQALGHLAVQDWKAGIVPWWNPYSGVGMPLAGEMQPAAFFLPFVLLLGVANGILYLKITLMIVAGLSMWGLLRALGLAAAPALLGALLFEVNGSFAWDADSSSLPIAFLPMFLLGIERARMPGRWRLIAVAVAYSVLSGFPETAFANGLLAFAWATLRFFQVGESRWRFARRVAAAGAIGLGIAAPQLLAFVSFLGQSDLALRDLGNAALLPANFAMFLFPYLYGPIFFNLLFDIWYRLGGYIGLPIALLAAAAVFAAWERIGIKDRALRLVLAGWIFCVLAKSVGLPVITAAFNLVPLVAQSLFYRYAAPSWECAAIILAAFALDDLLVAAPAARRRRLVCAAGFCAVLCVAALTAGRPVWRDLGSVADGRTWFLVATFWGGACAAITALAWLPAKPWRNTAFAVLFLDSTLQFTIPLLSGTRGEARRMDTAPLSFLQAHLGLQRFFTLGPLPPNYGAFFGLAELNHDYAPVPAAWVSYVQKNLDPHANPITFNGFAPSPENGMETRPEALRRRLQAYETTGVKYVLSPPFLHPFALSQTSLHKPAHALPLLLNPGQSATGSIGPGEYDAGRIAGAGVNIGTIQQSAHGLLTLKLCAGADCASGTTALANVADNSYAWVTLDHPISLGPADRLTYDIANGNGQGQIALWAWRGARLPDANLNGPGMNHAPLMPELQLLPATDANTPHLVFQGLHADIYELPKPAPYFEAPGCTTQDPTRTSVRLHCDAPTTLERRELAFPGWRAKVNGIPTSLGKNGIFQAIDIPRGDSTVTFAFAPPYIAWGYAASLISLLALAAPRRRRARA